MLQFLNISDLISLQNASVVNKEFSDLCRFSLDRLTIRDHRHDPNAIDRSDWVIRTRLMVENLSFRRLLMMTELISASLLTLKELSFDNCQSLNELARIGHCPALTKLSIHYCHIDQDILISFLNLHPHLTSLELTSMDSLTVDLLQQIKYFPNLRHLSLSYNRWITDQTVTPLFQDCTNLKSLCLSGTRIRNDATICRLISSLPHLSSLVYDKFSRDVYCLCLRSVIFPSILGDDQESQSLAMECLEQISGLSSLSLLFLFCSYSSPLCQRCLSLMRRRRRLSLLLSSFVF
jgi:Leucine-rich repeat (LRR) protein